LHERRGISRPI